VVVSEVLVVGLLAILVSQVVPEHEPGNPMNATNWARHTAGASLMFMVGLSSMRFHRSASILALVLSLALYGVNAVYFGPEPPHVMGAALLLLVGILGIRVADQQRRVLERFARTRLLRRFLPTAGVSAVEEGDDPYAAGTRAVTLTMMVTDLRGFTAMSETLAPEAMVAQLNEYHGAMLEEIERHGGMLDKFMGDGELAVFGWPSSADCGAAAAVACGRSMLVRLQALNVQRAAAGNASLAMGIGIHTGHVIAGAIGAAGRRLEFTFLGDAVNIASRIEGLTKSMGKPLLVSADTVARLPSASELEELGATQIRGRVEPVKLWSPIPG
jgi:class 3 adenylate cyclase